MGELKIPREILREIYEHAEKTYPSECCGFLMGEKGSDSVVSVRQLKNVYDEYHARDPQMYPRTSKTAYLIESIEILRVQREARSGNIELKAIYHSHVDVGAYFSDEDKRVATIDGQPAFPGVAYVVISCRANRAPNRNGKSDGAALFAWNAEQCDFVLACSF